MDDRSNDVLSPGHESALITAAQNGDECAAARLVAAHDRFIGWISRRVARGTGMDLDDLRSVAVLALLEAVRDFDLSRPVRLVTYAGARIRNALAAEVAAHRSGITLPAMTYWRYTDAVRHTESADQARTYARERHGMCGETFDAVHAVAESTQSLDQGWEDGASLGDRVQVDVVGGCPPVDVLATICDTDTHADLFRGMAALPERQRDVLTLAYLGDEPLSDAAIAARIGLSKATVVRARVAGLRALRESV